MLRRVNEGPGHAHATLFYYYLLITVIESFNWSLGVFESVGGFKRYEKILSSLALHYRTSPFRQRPLSEVSKKAPQL